MLYLWQRRGFDPSHSSALFCGLFSLGDYPCACGCPLGFSKDGKGSYTQLEGLFCGKEEEEDLEFGSPMYFLDSLEGKKLHSV